MMDEARYSICKNHTSFNTVGAPHVAVTSFEAGGSSPGWRRRVDVLANHRHETTWDHADHRLTMQILVVLSHMWRITNSTVLD